MIGGLLFFVGAIGGISIMIFLSNHLVSNWRTPPGRLWTTIIETEMKIPIILSILFLFLGLIIMGIEYFRKDK